MVLSLLASSDGASFQNNKILALFPNRPKRR